MTSDLERERLAVLTTLSRGSPQKILMKNENYDLNKKILVHLSIFLPPIPEAGGRVGGDIMAPAIT